MSKPLIMGILIAMAAAANAQTVKMDPKVSSLIDATAAKYELGDVLRSLVITESKGNPHAKSNKGAMGLGQLMPATAKAYGVKDPMDAAQNLRGTARFLRDLIKERHGDVRKALIAYHGLASVRDRMVKPRSAPCVAHAW